MDNIELGAEELERYARQIKLPEIGAAGQLKLKAGSVLVVGAGGLGSPAAAYLAAAGVGRLGIVEGDTVDVSNLQRQLLHGTPDLDRPKAESAADFISRLNPNVTVDIYPENISRDNAMQLVGKYDVVVDCCDNYATRYLVNDACMLAGRPYVYGSVYKYEGQASVFVRGESPCYRCLFPEPPPTEVVADSRGAGIIGPVPGVIGSVQANEALKLLFGIGRTLAGRLLVYDALEMDFRLMNLKADPDCELCGRNPVITELLDEY